MRHYPRRNVWLGFLVLPGVIIARENFPRNLGDFSLFPLRRNADATRADATITRRGIFAAKVTPSPATPPPPPSALRGLGATPPARRARCARTSPPPPLPLAFWAKGAAAIVAGRCAPATILIRPTARAFIPALTRDYPSSPTSPPPLPTQITPLRPLHPRPYLPRSSLCAHFTPAPTYPVKNAWTVRNSSASAPKEGCLCDVDCISPCS